MNDAMCLGQRTVSCIDVLDIAPQTAPVFMSSGMHCLGCPASRGETVEQACMVHGTDADELVKKLNAFVTEK